MLESTATVVTSDSVICRLSAEGLASAATRCTLREYLLILRDLIGEDKRGQITELRFQKLDSAACANGYYAMVNSLGSDYPLGVIDYVQAT